MVTYYENIQWAAAPPGRPRPHGPQLHEMFPLDASEFSMAELRAALGKLNGGKAAGPDEVPPEFWKALRHNAEASKCVPNL